MTEDLSFLRHYRLVNRTLECETTAPMFLGGADQQAQWRVEPFKALFRSWWRVTQPDEKNWQTLLKMEGSIFGRAGEERVTQKSPVTLVLSPDPTAKPVKPNFPTLQKTAHPEIKFGGGKVDPLVYLAGMGLLKKGEEHSCFPVGSKFRLDMWYPESLQQDMNAVLALISAFGALGGRCRNGWGSFKMADSLLDVSKKATLLKGVQRPWRKGLEKDYPNCLGADEKGPLLWKTALSSTWPETMAKLAAAYIQIRAASVKGDNKLDPGMGKAAERHLLGVPLTHHPAWGPNARHASPLRFCVKQESGKTWGLVAHIPHCHSNNQKFPPGVVPEATWEKVHRKLDALLERATYEECVS